MNNFERMLDKFYQKLLERKPNKRRLDHTRKEIQY